ncbi:MAG: OmpA family protein, partial [Alphaproteobacteria bacterium]|nr:OmpA family protein [Alphaproteobacteria bacterium]
MKFVYSAIVLTLLSACSSTWDVEAVRGMKAQGSLFDKVLKHEYTELAAAERAEGDWRDAAAFLRRARTSAIGESVKPEHVWERDIPKKRIAELRNARARLIRVLDGGARVYVPEEAALAQAGFDGLMQEMEENLNDGDIERCRKIYDSAMDILERKHITPPYADNKSIIYFDFGSIKIQQKMREILGKIAISYKRENPSSILVSGHADRVGTNHNNFKLS